MKNFKFVLFAALSLLAVSCDKDDEKDETPENTTIHDLSFKGNFVSTDKNVDLKDVNVVLDFDEDDKEVDVTLESINFGGNMPPMILVTLTLEDLPYTVSGSTITITETAPFYGYMNDEEYKSYAFSKFSAVVTGEENISLTTVCGDGNYSYNGTLDK